MSVIYDGSHKIHAIKAVRTVLQVGLKAAKDAVECSMLPEGITAAELRDKLNCSLYALSYPCASVLNLIDDGWAPTGMTYIGRFRVACPVTVIYTRPIAEAFKIVY